MLLLKQTHTFTHIRALEGFPSTINVEPGVDARQTIVAGPGLEDGILDTHPQYFTVEYRDSHGRPLGAKGVGMPPLVEIQGARCVRGLCNCLLTCAFCVGPKGKVVPRVTDNGDGTYRVDYEPIVAGDHKINVTLDGASRHLFFHVRCWLTSVHAQAST